MFVPIMAWSTLHLMRVTLPDKKLTTEQLARYVFAEVNVILALRIIEATKVLGNRCALN